MLNIKARAYAQSATNTTCLARRDGHMRILRHFLPLLLGATLATTVNAEELGVTAATPMTEESQRAFAAHWNPILRHALQDGRVYTVENTPTCDRNRGYPKEARKAGLEGTTDLIVLVGADKRISRAVIGESSGHEVLDAAAAGCAIRKGQFEPRIVDGKPVESWQLMRWTWKLRP